MLNAAQCRSHDSRRLGQKQRSPPSAAIDGITYLVAYCYSSIALFSVVFFVFIHSFIHSFIYLHQKTKVHRLSLHKKIKERMHTERQRQIYI